MTKEKSVFKVRNLDGKEFSRTFECPSCKKNEVEVVIVNNTAYHAIDNGKIEEYTDKDGNTFYCMCAEFSHTDIDEGEATEYRCFTCGEQLPVENEQQFVNAIAAGKFCKKS